MPFPTDSSVPVNPLATHYPEYTVSDTVDLGIKFVGESVDFAYSTEITKGAGWLSKSKAHEPSVLPVQVLTWDQFRDQVVKADARTHVFRGQCSQHRLRTTFHRTRRKNLARYRDMDIDQVRRILSPILKHVFDRRDPFQTGGLYSLIQHHGYPTPLLDWSYSPFVAAYFAFRSKPGARPNTDFVRVFSFNRKDWHTDYDAYTSIAYAKPHVSFADFLGIENPRMVPQQATALITNVDDIEGYVMGLQQIRGKSYLSAIDIPLSERDLALSELDLMGINAGSMFPGIDGACEGLTYKNFGI